MIFIFFFSLKIKSAPVIDPCGSAGGRHPGQGNGGFGAQYQDTTNAKVGDLGSKTLPVTSSGTKWTAGSTVEVAWTLQANHGGGYSYRLCPASSPLTEACFQLTPLSFAGPQSAFRWGGVDGKTHYYNRTMVGGAGARSSFLLNTYQFEVLSLDSTVILCLIIIMMNIL